MGGSNRDKIWRTAKVNDPADWNLNKTDFGTEWRKAHNLAAHTSGSWNHKPSPYCAVEECYAAPIARFPNGVGFCEHHAKIAQEAEDCFREPVLPTSCDGHAE